MNEGMREGYHVFMCVCERERETDRQTQRINEILFENNMCPEIIFFSA